MNNFEKDILENQLNRRKSIYNSIKKGGVGSGDYQHKKSFKISVDYWNTLKTFEQEYIKQRIHNSNSFDNIQMLKQRINDARKQHPDYVKIYGKGFIDLPNGETYLYSGEDTRKFVKVNV